MTNERGKRDVEIMYKLADGKTVPVDVSPAVARFLEKEAKRERTRHREDRRFLDKDGYVEGETELLLHDLGEGVVAQVERRERNTKINAAINALPPRQRSYLHAYYFKAYTMQEIADMEEISKVMVHRILAKARENLRALLARDGSFEGYHMIFDDEE